MRIHAKDVANAWKQTTADIIAGKKPSNILDCCHRVTTLSNFSPCLSFHFFYFVTRCFAWFEGLKCEKRMKIPYRPLSDRMLQEPFWLGLITVFVVLAVIGLVWCAKRHFPEKIEKLLQEEAEKSRRKSQFCRTIIACNLMD